MSIDISYLKFDDMSKPVRFIDCQELIKCFRWVFSGWIIDELEPDTLNALPVLEVKRNDNNYLIEGYWLANPVTRVGVVAAVCGFVAELMRAYVSEDSKLLCLHGAAAEFAGKLVVFPSRYRSGKSILSACMASSDIQLFCDDVLPISLSNGYGIAPGLAPRLRRPLPDNLDQASFSFIERHAGITGNNYQYLNLESGQLAQKDSLAPIGAFVLLEREEGAKAGFEDVSEAEVLSQVVWQNFAREADAPLILEVLSQLVSNSQICRLRFDRAEDAVKLLQGRFSDWTDTEESIAGNLIEVSVNSTNNLSPGYFIRKSGVNIVSVDNQSFLADSQGASIHHLNSVGTAIWTLLEEPMCIENLVEVILTAFPDVDVELIETDLNKLVGELVKKDLLLDGSE
ncbi:MAG: PqqD family protein [Gammaproteobacteria bacterium]|nr:PqqD family protein [Gammaproteobacteria bacterium]